MLGRCLWRGRWVVATTERVMMGQSCLSFPAQTPAWAIYSASVAGVSIGAFSGCDTRGAHGQFAWARSDPSRLIFAKLWRTILPQLTREGGTAILGSMLRENTSPPAKFSSVCFCRGMGTPHKLEGHWSLIISRTQSYAACEEVTRKVKES